MAGVRPSFFAVGLYSKTSSLQLALSYIIEEYKDDKIIEVSCSCESLDKIVAKQTHESAVAENGKYKRAWRCQIRVRMRVLVGTVRQGLEVTDRARWSETSVKEKNDLVLKR